VVTICVHVCTELAQSLVKVVHLSHDRGDGNNQEDISAWVGELIGSTKGKLERNAQSLDGADGDGTDSAANAEVDHWVLLAVLGCNPVYHDCRECDDEEAVE